MCEEDRGREPIMRRKISLGTFSRGDSGPGLAGRQGDGLKEGGSNFVSMITAAPNPSLA